jgi:hypothetical protein
MIRKYLLNKFCKPSFLYPFWVRWFVVFLHDAYNMYPVMNNKGCLEWLRWNDNGAVDRVKI